VGEVTVNIDLETRGKEDDSEGIIIVTVQSVEVDKLYRFLVQMVGVVKRDEGQKNLGVREYLSKQGPAMMFPFVREAVFNLTSKGRFGPVYLRPLNTTLLDSPQASSQPRAEEVQQG
jgi:preprotein translocase subunit SecB